MPKVIDLPNASSMNDSDYLLMESSGGGTKKITRANALPSTKNGVVSADTTAVTSLANNTNTTVQSMSLSAGIWIISGQLKVLGGGDFTVTLGISLIDANVQPSGGGSISIRATPSGWTAAHATRIVALTGTTTVYLVGFQNSGSAKNVNASDTRMYAVKVG